MKRLAVDVGGTFTDCVVLDEKGTLRQFKSPTTPRDPSLGLLACLEKAAASDNQLLPSFLANIDLLIHGTTLATNTLINENGALTGMITTRDFRDVIELRRGFKNPRTSMYNLFVPTYKPLIPRALRLGVEERTLYTGEILTPLNEAETRDALAALQAKGVQSIAICFLHSYANPAHEQRAREIARVNGSEIYLTASHEILPVWREYDRFSTTMVSAYIGPVVERYLRTLEERLAGAGFGGALLLMLSSGLVQTVEHCIPRAVYLISSGPAAAPSAALHLGGALDRRNLISVDMGGTSFDICLIREGQIPTTTEGWVGDERVAIKMVDIHSVGAGGGSVAWMDRLGLLRVGPRSAGAEPGPACYGKGGQEPTVTDADLLLGYIPADFFLGGEITLDTERARETLRKVADPMGLTVEQAAQAIFTTVNSFMADQIMEVSTKQGYDVRDFALVVGGGAGPVHGAFIADRLEIPTVLIPVVSATYSAFGMFAMDVGRDYARSCIARADRFDFNRVNELYAEMEKEALDSFGAMGVSEKSVVFARTAEMRYVGQFHEVETPVSSGKLTPQALEAVIQAFSARHTELYTFNMPWKGVEFLTFRLKAAAPRAPVKLERIRKGEADPAPALKRTRTCWFEGQEVATSVYDGAKLLAGNVLRGPAIIEERATSVVIPRSFTCHVSDSKSYVLKRQ